MISSKTKNKKTTVKESKEAPKTFVQNSMEDKINSIATYTNEIETLHFPEDLIMNRTMYIGNDGDLGFLNMIREVFQNSFDQFLKYPCQFIRVYYNEVTKYCLIGDNGIGLPFDKMHKIYTDTHTGSNYHKKPGNYTSGRHGLGAKITNALSDHFLVKTYRQNLGARSIEYRRGISKNGVVEIPNKNNKLGTDIEFHPNEQILGEINLTCEEIINMLKGIIFLGKLGKVVEFHGITATGKKFCMDLVNKNGILSDLIDSGRVKSPIMKPVQMFKDDGQCKADIAFTFDVEDFNMEIHSYANYSPTKDAGTHVTGFINGVTKFFVDYMNKIYLATANKPKAKSKSKSSSTKKKDKPLAVTSADVKCGLKGIVSVCALIPNFGGQSKDSLVNKEMEGFVKDLVLESLDEWGKSNPKDLDRVCSYLKAVAKNRLASEKEREKLTQRYASSAFSKTPAKYVKPTGNKDLEFIIVEGDSALGPARKTRCSKRQGIFPIRGKISNIFGMTPSNKTKFLENAEIQGIISIISEGTKNSVKYGPTFMPEDTKYKKIIIMSDADPDGDHIAVLLLKLFMVLYPRLVEAGMVYRAIAPLYGLPGRKGKVEKYFTTRYDYVQWLFDRYSKTNTICDINGRKLIPSEAKKILYDNADYTYDLNEYTYRMSPRILEQIIFSYISAKNSNKDFFKVLKKDINSNKEFRFLKVTQENGIPIIEGEYDDLMQEAVCTPAFFDEIKHLIEHVEKNSSVQFILNEKSATLYQLMSSFESSAPASITRYKGLGEMNGYDLKVTTLHPDYNRTLIRYTMDSASKYIEEMRYLEADKNRILTGLKNTRNDLIG